MCGIHLQAWKQGTVCDICQQCQSVDGERSNLRRRGPDACCEISLDTVPTFTSISLQASVLQMRQELVTQPLNLSDDEHDPIYLCWNGEIYQASDDDDAVAGAFGSSDTQLVASLLRDAFRESGSGRAVASSSIAELIASVLSRFYNAEFAVLVLTSTHVYFGRDSWGRRSLLQWDCPQSCGSFRIQSTAEEETTTPHEDEQEHDDDDGGGGGGEGSVSNSHNTMEEGPTPWTEIPPGMVHQISFFDPTMETLSIPFSPIAVHVPLSALPDPIPPTPQDVTPELWKASLEFERHLSNAVAMRILDQSSSTSHPTGVLFSGGLDSAVVAALAAQHCSEPLILYNVSFGPSYEKSADRKAALVTYQALQELHPTKDIRFQDIIVDWDDIQRHESHIRTLLQPKSTLMDINIATALWFASRGRAKDSDDQEMDEFCHPRVLLLGMGADEQLGGYGRHRKAYDRGGWDELKIELDMDQARFWERNLGRDDRIVADHGKEARFPFLDVHVTQYLKHLPLDQVCDFSLPPGHGDKRILRLVALRLGLDHASGLVKRAIQFGSRISHLSDAKRFGSRRKAKGEATVRKGPSSRK